MSSVAEIWFVDSEWGFTDGRTDEESAFVPVVFCAVGLHSGRRLSFWGKDPRLATFLAEHCADLFVAHYAIAEMKYLLRLGLPLPKQWYDTFVDFRHRTNGPGHAPAGLSAALHQLGLPHLAPAVKQDLQQKILHLDFDAEDAADRQAIRDYCLSDCDGCSALYARLNSAAIMPKMAHWSDYLKAVARMELRGLPFDYRTHNLIHAKKSEIRKKLIADINATVPVYRDGSFHQASFISWCTDNGIPWPTKSSAARGGAYYPLDRETFKAMEHWHPFIGRLREVRKTLDSLGQRALVVDAGAHRHYFSTSVFRSMTGRNQPSAFVFNGPKWSRSLVLAESPEHILLYVDYVGQEIGLAAALSEDAAMREMYQSSDCHMAFAIRAGAAPRSATKATHGAIRNRFKTVNLGVLFGLTAFGISQRLGIPQREAEKLLDEHRRLFPQFWRWSEATVQGAYDRGWITTPCGWRSQVPKHSNERCWMNWPMQSAGGDVMRLTVTYLDRQNVRLLAPVHDGFVLSCRRDQLNDLREAVDFACRSAVEHVVPGFPLRWDFKIFERGFEDEDGLPLWKKLQVILSEID